MRAKFETEQMINECNQQAKALGADIKLAGRYHSADLISRVITRMYLELTEIHVH